MTSPRRGWCPDQTDATIQRRSNGRASGKHTRTLHFEFGPRSLDRLYAHLPFAADPEAVKFD